MAANFQQHMGGPGQMMPQQRQQQGGNQMSQIQHMILTTLNAQTPNPAGWQAQILVQERMTLIFNIIGNLRLASQNQPNPPTLQKMVDIAIRFEKEIFEKSNDKAGYKRAVDDKLAQLMERRNQNQAGLQQSIQQQAQAQAQAQQAHAQQMMMNQNTMQGQMPRAMPQQPVQQGFQHLQHQMQASPIPGQQPQQMAMGLSNDGIPQNMPQQQFQMQMQQPQPQMPQQNMPARPNGQMQMSAQDNALINEWTNRLMAQASVEEKNNIRNQLQGRIDPATLQRHQAQGVDIASLYFRNQAIIRLRADKQQRAQAQAQAQAQLGLPPGQNIPGPPAMQQQRSMNPSPMNGQAPPPTSIGGDGSFLGNMENLVVQQQQQGVMAQAGGEVVVPASNAPHNATPQPPTMNGPPGEQRATPVSRAQQQQQIFNAQQVQQQRLQHAAQQQQQQSQARLNAQTKAQQIGLQGQPGGMGPGPMHPQQSPAMATLNAPLRTPAQQMNHSEPPPMNPAQFGQSLDPRFGPGNQRPMGAVNGLNIAGLSAEMIAGMPQNQQQRLASLPPDKLNEMVAKWTEQRAQQMNQNAQGLRQGMPMQGNRVGQQAPSGQFNPQAAAIQNFITTNPGRPLPPAMAASLNAQQQMLLQQQMQRMQQQQQNANQLQQRNGQQVLTPNEQRTVAQMDNTDFPPAIHSHAHMPAGIPPDIKKWGQLKAWIHQNPNLEPTTMENIKNLQKLHYQQIMRARQQQQGPPGMMQAGTTGQHAIPNVPTGLAAPVAPMGQTPMQMQNPMGVRPPTQEDINAARAHPSHPNMVNASDDQIRAYLMRQQASVPPAQMAQRQQALMQMGQLGQMNPQQNRPGQQQPNSTQVKQPPAQASQVKQPANEQGTKTAGNRQNRQPQNVRNAAPTSSPAQPPKNLKRGSSSDDVQEVPNPNIPQARAVPPVGPPVLTPQQIAQLNPEQKKKYELILRVQQNRQQTQMSSADMQKLRAIAQEEAKRPREADVPMDPETKAAAATKLRAIVPPLSNVLKAVPRWFQITLDETRARAFFRAKHRIQAQFKDNEMSQLKDVFSMRPIDIEGARVMLSTMVKDLSDKFPSMIKPETTQPQPPSLNAPSSQQAPVQSIPLNAANLHQQQQQLNKLHQRSNSRSSHPPAAPTSTQPPFQFGAPSPHGTPAYIGKTTITQDNLHIPARKKQKQASSTPVIGQTTTPVSNSSPLVGKAISPEARRENKAQPRPSFVCTERDCEKANSGFESEEALKAHIQDEHIKPKENPETYAVESLASAFKLELDANGQPIEPVLSTGQNAGFKNTSGPKQGQTPIIKGEVMSNAGTPMNRQASTNRQGSVGGSKQKATPSKEALLKEPSAKLDGNQSILEPQETIPIDLWANTTVDPHDLFQAFEPFESGANGAISDMHVYRAITENDTPESSASKDGVSEPTSDLSDGVALDISLDIFDDNWAPFGQPQLDPMGDMTTMDVNEDDLRMFDDDEPEEKIPNYEKWEDWVDPSSLDKPFVFDTSLYSLNM